MKENYLTPAEAAQKLKIGNTKFYAILPKLMARGLKRVRIGRHVRYFESTLDAMIRKAAETETPLY